RLQVLQGDLQLNGDYERVENLRNVNEKFVEYLSGEEGEEVYSSLKSIKEDLDGGKALKNFKSVYNCVLGIYEYKKDFARIQNASSLDELEELGYVSLDEVLEPFKEKATEFDGLDSGEVVGDRALYLVSHTIMKNYRSYVEPRVDNPELYVDVKDSGRYYVVDILNNGPSLEKHPEEIFRHKDGSSGRGLYLASFISDSFGGSISYSEELSEEIEKDGRGFGLRWYLPKPPKDTKY
ncbi:MAG: hypothetical protein MUP58_00005, partial [Candidatus Nanohaloarchaeota archaeon QJJ-9]|nr:hypothetical protein [Candidatus Nanohaloarchaeota archaeon QJJ-9]